MPLLIHASVRVTGPAEPLSVFRGVLNRLLLDEFAEIDVEERHRENELIYDFKVTGGIPFPALVQASSGHPDISVTIEWVNAEAGVKGYAVIENGQLKESRTDKLGGRGESNLLSIAVGDDASLVLALTFLTHIPRETLGYAVTSERDALVRIVEVGDRKIDVYASSGDEPKWEDKWAIDFETGSFDYAETSDAIDEPLYLALRKHAEDFAAEWLWFSSAPAVETAIERERFRAAGYPVHGANVRYEKLRSLTHEPMRFTSEPLQSYEQLIRQVLSDD
jgi:hypothetical protein